MTEITQDEVFQGVAGFEKTILPSGECYRSKNGIFCRLGHFALFYVLECAESSDAANNIFEDANLFDDDLPKDVLLKQMRESINEYLTY